MLAAQSQWSIITNRVHYPIDILVYIYDCIRILICLSIDTRRDCNLYRRLCCWRHTIQKNVASDIRKWHTNRRDAMRWLAGLNSKLLPVVGAENWGVCAPSWEECFVWARVMFEWQIGCGLCKRNRCNQAIVIMRTYFMKATLLMIWFCS